MLVSASCKYEEGPGISLRTKKARLSGNWEVEKISENDGDVYTPNGNNSIKYTFNKSGSGDGEFKTFGITTTRTFDWEFKNSKEEIKITYNNGDIIYTTILRLTNEEMVLVTPENDRWELEKI